MNIQRVLAPVDFSPTSTLAVNYAVAFAGRFRSKLSLLHVIEPPSALLHAFPGEAERIESQRRAQAEKMLPALVSPEEEDALDVRYLVAKGPAEETIEAVAREEQADVVVLGTHGRSLFSRLLLGSVTQGLLRKLGIPVLTVSRVARPLDFKRILFATDFGPDSESAFHTALELAGEIGSLLVVAHTIDKRPAVIHETPEVKKVFDEDRERDMKEARDKFEEFRAAAATQKVGVECVLAQGDVSEELLRIADEHEVDFMVLGLREKESWRGLCLDQ